MLYTYRSSGGIVLIKVFGVGSFFFNFQIFELCTVFSGVWKIVVPSGLEHLSMVK